MVYPFQSRRAINTDARPALQDRIIAFYLAGDGPCLCIGYIQCFLGYDIVRTFYLDKGTAVVTFLHQDGLVTSRAAKHHTAGMDA